MNSRLPQLLDFEENDINWLKCHENACSSLVKKACDLRNDNKSLQDIANILKLDKNTIFQYVKKGSKLGWCNNYSKKEVRKNLRLIKKIICITTNKVFDGFEDAAKYYDLSACNICNCCKHKQNSAGTHSETGQPLKWMYYKDYLFFKNSSNK